MARRKITYDVPDDQPDSPAQAEESSVYARGQTVVPKMIREALGIDYGTRLHWEVREGVIHVVPLPQQPATALRGILKGTGITSAWFLQQRAQARKQEKEQEQRWEQQEAPRKRGRRATS